MAEKKMTTGGFFRGLLRRAVYGEAVENPLVTVAKAAMKEGAKRDGKETLETEAQETRGDSEHEGAKD